jgi:hypothetical protein
MSRLRRLVLFPFHADISGIVPTALENPYDLAGFGMTSSPNIHITNFNVQVSGQPVFPEPINSDFQFWQNAKQMYLNGGAIGEVQSGLVSYDEWSRGGFKHYVVDLSRTSDYAADDMMKNLTVTMSCSVKTQWLAVVYQEKSMKIQAEAGQLVVE